MIIHEGHGIGGRINVTMETDEYIVILRERGGDKEVCSDQATADSDYKRACAMMGLSEELKRWAFDLVAKKALE